MERMRFLVEKLNAASNAYYNLDYEIMSDFEYDKLYDELLELEKNLSVTLDDSPTKNVGYKSVDSLKKVVHEKKMLSLDKTKNVEKLSEFLADKIGLISWKLDGLTIVLKYSNGFLKQIVTRGNGEIGEDITHNAGVFKNLPRKINFKDDLILRGEAVISYSDFNRINEKVLADSKYKNPRNLCSGTVRNLKFENVSDRPVYFFAFELVNADGVDFKNSKLQKFIWLKNLGFDVVDYKMTDAKNIFDNVNWFKSNINNFDFATDGLVVTLDDINYSNQLGVTSKFPRDSIAFKWSDDTRLTKLLQIQWSVSRTGLINPIAVFDPIEIDGTKINKASLHNLSFIKNMKLGIGDKIKVYKANMIIPQIAENITQSNNLVLPQKCPVCQHNVQILKMNSSEFLLCPNPNCTAKLIMTLTHFASRDAMNIEGLSEMIITKFVESGFLKSYVDIYELEKYEQEIKFYQILDSKSPNKNHKLYSNLIAAIEKSKHVFLYNFIYALGINQVGLSNAKILCEEFDWDIEKIKSATLEDLNMIHGFGESISNSIVDYFSDNENLKLLDKILPMLDFKIASDTKKNLSGLTFVITGNMINFDNRNQLVNLIESLGGKVSSAVSKKTTALINNNPQSKSSKNLKAMELSVPIITEDDFLSKYDINRG